MTGTLGGVPQAWSKAYELFRAIPRTLCFNLRYLPLRQAIRLPVIVSHRVAFSSLGGRVRLTAPARPGMVRIGFGRIGIFDRARLRAVWHVEKGAEVLLGADVRIAHGAALDVRGRLVLGDRVQLMPDSRVMCHLSVTFNTNSGMSWQTLLMDSDHHGVAAADGQMHSYEAPVEIGENVWIGTGVTVLKGVSLPPGTMVAAGTTVHRSFTEDRPLIVGAPARVARTGITWEL